MKTRFFLSVMAVVLLSLAGCQQQQMDLALNFQPDDEVLYRVVTESGKDYEFLQPSINESTENHTVSRIEMVFAQKTESIDKNGDAVLNITINELKYFASGPKGTTIDFDGCREKDKSEPLAKLIGQSYKIKLTSAGKVEVIDVKAAREIIKAGFAGKVAQRLLSNGEIEKRHNVLALVDAERNYIQGQNWSTLASSPPGMLQSKSYEKQYTLQEVKDQDGQQIAMITMDAVPSSKRAPDMSSDSMGMGSFAKMFEDSDIYKGELLLNLSTGQIIRYRESLLAEWVAAEPTEEQKSDKGPDTLTMGFTHSYSIEMIND